MAPSLHQPHDHLFRLVFADSEETAAFLRARLPDSLRRRFLWSSLRRAPGSFVDQQLRGSVSDLLFEVRTAAARRGGLLPGVHGVHCESWAGGHAASAG